MKRVLLFGTAALMAFAVVFTACQDPLTNPDDITETTVESIPSLSGPETVVATAYPGANLITWDFVKDAKSYSIYRQDDETGVRVHLKTQPVGPNEVNYYVDAVGFKNQLVDERSYTYTVTANSGQSTSHRALVDETVIFDGVSSVTVIADIPARSASVTELLAADITDERITSGSGEKLLVSWPTGNPAFTYEVEYLLGKAAPLTLATFIPVGNDILGQNYYATPLFGGENTLNVTVKFNSSNDDNDYYYQPTTVPKELPKYNLSTIDAPAWVGVERDENGTGATIAWTPTALAKTAADFRLYRAEVELSPKYWSPPENPLSPPYSSVTITGDWTLVPLTAVEQTGSSIWVLDTGLELDKAYTYVLYAQVGTAKSASVPYTIPALTQSPAPLLDFDATAFTETANNGDVTYKATIGWMAQTGVSYELKRATVSTYPSVSVSAYETTLPVPAAVAGRYTVIDTPPIRHSYRYQLTATSGGVVKTYYADLEGEPFEDSVNIGLWVSDSSDNYAYSTGVTLQPTGAYVDDLTVDLYRAEAKNANQEGWTKNNSGVEKAAFTKITTISLADGLGTYRDSGLITGTLYVYRIEVKVGDTVLPNTNYELKNDSGYVQIPSVPVISYDGISDAGSVPTGSGASAFSTQYFTLPYAGYNNYPSNYKDAIVRLQRYAIDNPQGLWVDAGVAGTVVQAPDTPLGATTTPPASSGVGSGDWYFSIREPSATDKPLYNYRLVVVNGDGNTSGSSLWSDTVNNW
ncbi:MAG: hypothetical protein LBQ30_01340 [Treponema sp.]|nr:hypothetical protein [Treponema sp.]